MHTQLSKAELKSSCFCFTARELRSSELCEALGKEQQLRRKFIINRNFKSCSNYSKVGSVKRADPKKDQRYF